MERSVSFDVTDYYPDGDDWSNDLSPLNNSMSGSSSPIDHRPDPEDATECVTITLDIHGDSVFVVSVEPLGDGELSVEGNREPGLQRRNRQDKKFSEKRPRKPKFEASKALEGVRMFISMTDAGWIAVEKRFDKMKAKNDGLLLRSRFGECLGINSKKFALELFDTLARRWNITCEGVSKCELRGVWCQIIDQSFDSRLRMFFDMADKDGDRRLTEEEVREFIRLTASASNQSITQNMANAYAALIMEELDIDNQGYITMEILKLLLLNVETLSEITRIEETKKRKKRWYRFIGDISSSTFIPCLKKKAL